MNSKHRFVLTTLMVATLAACSGSEERRRQANQDFTYLETKPLMEWELPAGTEPYNTDDFAIPARSFAGEIGSGVDIRPPQQVLALIPGARVVKNGEGVTLMLANSEELAGVWSLTKTMLSEQGITLRDQSANRMETDWVTWTNEDNETQISSRYVIEKSDQPGRNSYQISLVDWREGETTEPVSTLNKERYSILMTNLVTSRYDAQVREEARIRAQELVKQIPISMGQDRSGLPVIIARASYNVFWERLPSLLDQLGFTVEGRNRSQGVVEVKFRGQDDQFWTDLGVKPIELDDSTYRLQLGDLGNRTSLNVTDSDGKPVTERALESLAPVFAKAIERTN
ncbi:outer membrane assembly protein BamC [Photobacterium jeanii]|uniref:Outer membrane protein assembly factor BamC n=1 Tax=Photobacterium jeanii TaxID=858640 RepID=A0A178KNF1_9GAMM|nr:outer membrane protein assembly factor BamC [Photobacterium jeanii]OAN18730.1 outer membrane assembly protein BamC [Photobacterium jeanii]PST86274.1 outer membrane protein assembly factor BamC [Photobacterium jeanii]